jgi:hypothetical protein
MPQAMANLKYGTADTLSRRYIHEHLEYQHAVVELSRATNDLEWRAGAARCSVPVHSLARRDADSRYPCHRRRRGQPSLQPPHCAWCSTSSC